MEETQKKSKLPLISVIFGIVSWVSFISMIPMGMIIKGIGGKIDGNVGGIVWLCFVYGFALIGLILSIISKGKSGLKSAGFIINGIPVAILIFSLITTLFHLL